MWKNYFKVSFRNLMKRKLYTGINILGLTVAIVSFLAIALYIYHEATYDSMYSDSERVVRFAQKFERSGEEQVVAMTPSALVPALMEEIEEVEVATLIFDYSIFSSVLIDGGQGNREESKFAFVDENFFEIFNLELLAGAEGKLLTEPNQIVLTYSAAQRYFQRPLLTVGSTIKVDGTDYQVTGIVSDFPSNSHLDFDFLASFITTRHGKDPQWSPANYYSYAKLIPNTDKEVFAGKLDQMVEKYLGEQLRSYGFEVAMLFQPLTSIYLGDSQLKEMKPASDIKNLYIFGSVAILLIIIGIINYVNLATAESTERNKEVGLRKVLGAGRPQLFGQLLSESMILSTAGVLFSLLVIYLLKGFFMDFSGVPLRLELLFSPLGFSLMIALLILIGLFSGFYPAIVLSGLEPLKALGKKFTGANEGGWLRRGLVVFQFFVSISLLLATFIVKKQLDYMQTVNLGYDREQVIALNFHYNMMEKVSSFKNEVDRTGAAQSVSLSNSLPIFIQAGYSVSPGGDNDKDFMITGFAVDHDILQTLSLNLIAGTDFSKQDINQSEAYESQSEMNIIFNEAAIKEMGWEVEESIGRKVNYNGLICNIKGVVQDFYFNSLHHQVGPLAIFIQPSEANWILAKLPKGSPNESITKLEEVWKGLFPDRPFTYRFLDEEYDKMYQAEMKVSSIFGVFAGIAIFIACMGLFGLVSYVAMRRTREISIRKVLGADAIDVLKVLSSDFFVLLTVSAIMAVGFGLWFKGIWLGGFAYKTDISLSIYLLSILMVLIIAILTIGYRTLKVFALNPAKTLKDD
ncbi:FtsX-like permease family protein [Arthrospiribacter ruber]|uniref:FtsX-like permease family protein n=1 Tax=Arthrospiribacter ruber TaxID=2487934 RepID=A0A951MBR6_9BACT|nr:FtsX-like permease family protein [Arthrospiribacter ruber]MBW3466465.1 FtsX-like permease family protein [Arthrospiribacter ruber]